MIPDPRAVSGLMSEGPAARPVIKLFIDAIPRFQRLKAERLSAKIEQRLTRCIHGKGELRSERSQRIGCVARLCRFESFPGRDQSGRSMTFPQFVQVRETGSEKKRSKTGGN